MRRTARAALAYAKNGSGNSLLLLDSLLVALLLYDAWQLTSRSLSYFSLAMEGTWGDLGVGSLIDFLILLLLPLTLGILANFTIYKLWPRHYYRYALTTRARTWILLLHVSVVSGAVLHISLSDFFSLSAGPCGGLGIQTACYVSVFRFLETFRIWLLLGVLAPFVQLLLKDSIYKDRRLLDEFLYWQRIGAYGEFQPSYGDEIIYVNSASMAPSIRAIGMRTSEFGTDFQRFVPTSRKAKDFLLREAEAARRQLNEYLLPGEEDLQKQMLIEFFTGTSRALEVGILRNRAVSHVVLSQYEHPSQVDVVRWVADTTKDIEFVSLRPESPDFFARSWEKQKTEVVSSIAETIEDWVDRDHVAVVLSEVHYITGMVIPVEEIMEALRRDFDNLVFVIDGSQAVGSLERPLGHRAQKFIRHDFYYFSAHKWLLSPNTCGVLVGPINDASGKDREPYDVFGLHLPTSTIDPNTIFGLRAALDFLLREERFRRFRERSDAALRFFGEKVEERGRLEVLRCASEGLRNAPFLAVRPAGGFEWRYDVNGFWERMRKKGVDVTLIAVDEEHFSVSVARDVDGGEESRDYLLRISFPYFLVGRNVASLVKYLEAVVRTAT